jgi:hypothetical protein
MTIREHFPESDTAVSRGKNGTDWRLKEFGFRSLVLDNRGLLRDRWIDPVSRSET